MTQWTDMTGTVPLQVIDGCVSFTSVVSARWLPVYLSLSLCMSVCSSVSLSICLLPIVVVVVFSKAVTNANTGSQRSSRSSFVVAVCVWRSQHCRCIRSHSPFSLVWGAKKSEAGEGANALPRNFFSFFPLKMTHSSDFGCIPGNVCNSGIYSSRENAPGVTAVSCYVTLLCYGIV